MAFERLTIKKIYYYVICGVTLFVLMWGTVDIISSILSISIFKGPSISLENPEAQPTSGGKGGTADQPFFDEYYQSRMMFDRMGDSVARLLVAGALFIYAGNRIRELEGKEI